MKKFKKVKKIEIEYTKDNIKETHYNYRKNGIATCRYIIIKEDDNTIIKKLVDSKKKVTLTKDSNNNIIKVECGKHTGSAKYEYKDNLIIKKETETQKEYYEYINNKMLCCVINDHVYNVISNSVQEVYIDSNFNLYKIIFYDTKHRPIRKSYTNYYIEYVYDKWGKVTNIEYYSSL